MSSIFKEILTKWQNDFHFREEFKKNPELAIKNAGLTISREDLSKIKSTIESTPLDPRVNK